MVEQGDKIGRADHLDIAGPGGFRTLRGGADQAEPARRGVDRSEQHAWRRRNPSVEAELADRQIGGKQLPVDRAHRREQAERDRQIVMRAFLGKIGRRQIDGDPLRRQRQPDRRKRRMDPLPALAHRFVGKADDEEFGQAGRDLHLDLDGPRLQPEKRNRGDVRDHSIPLCSLIEDGSRNVERRSQALSVPPSDLSATSVNLEFFECFRDPRPPQVILDFKTCQ